jgi:hypothetical protein
VSAVLCRAILCSINACRFPYLNALDDRLLPRGDGALSMFFGAFRT